jgi:hypothetical protein
MKLSVLFAGAALAFAVIASPSLVTAQPAPPPPAPGVPPPASTNLYIVTNTGVSLVGTFSRIGNLSSHDVCMEAAESALTRNSGPVANAGNAPLYVTTLCVNAKY